MKLDILGHSGACCGIRELVPHTDIHRIYAGEVSHRQYDRLYQNSFAYLVASEYCPTELRTFSVELFGGLLLCNVVPLTTDRMPWSGGRQRLKPVYAGEVSHLSPSLSGTEKVLYCFCPDTDFSSMVSPYPLGSERSYCVLNENQVRRIDTRWFPDQGWVPRAVWISHTTQRTLYAFTRNAQG